MFHHLKRDQDGKVIFRVAIKFDTKNVKAMQEFSLASNNISYDVSKITEELQNKGMTHIRVQIKAEPDLSSPIVPIKPEGFVN